MIQRTIEGDYGSDIEIYHLRMSFSSDIKEVGKFRFGKLAHLIELIFSIYRIRITMKTSTLFYFPAGPGNVPLIRDLLLLGTTRWLFKRTVFQFRAAGLGEFISSKNSITQAIIKRIYGRPSIAIVLSSYSPKDYIPFKPDKVRILNNGIEDIPDNIEKKTSEDVVKFCYLGSLKESKGILDLFESFQNIKSDIDTELHLIGTSDSEHFMIQLKESAADICQQENKDIVIHGEKTGLEKHELISQCDIFVFPSFYESESLPGAIIEAMSHSMPIIATEWRGIPTLVDETNGVLLPIHDTNALATQMKLYTEDRELCKAKGEKSREKFERRFTLDVFHDNLKKILQEI
jgi:glycosyltransferase involved in cell wall biosynthesis